MTEPYVTIGGKQVFPKPPVSATSHPSTEAREAAWEENWERETTRVSLPVSGGLLVLLLIIVLWRLLRRK